MIIIMQKSSLEAIRDRYSHNTIFISYLIKINQKRHKTAHSPKVQTCWVRLGSSMQPHWCQGQRNRGETRGAKLSPLLSHAHTINYSNIVLHGCLQKSARIKIATKSVQKLLPKCIRNTLRESKFPKFSGGSMPPDPPRWAMGIICPQHNFFHSTTSGNSIAKTNKEKDKLLFVTYRACLTHLTLLFRTQILKLHDYSGDIPEDMLAICSEESICDLLLSLDVSKSCGSDSISAQMFKHTAINIAPAVSYLTSPLRKERYLKTGNNPRWFKSQRFSLLKNPLTVIDQFSC